MNTSLRKKHKFIVVLLFLLVPSFFGFIMYIKWQEYCFVKKQEVTQTNFPFTTSGVLQFEKHEPCCNNNSIFFKLESKKELQQTQKKNNYRITVKPKKSFKLPNVQLYYSTAKITSKTLPLDTLYIGSLQGNQKVLFNVNKLDVNLNKWYFVFYSQAYKKIIHQIEVKR